MTHSLEELNNPFQINWIFRKLHTTVQMVHRGSYMSAHVLLNLLNEFYFARV